MIFILFFWSGTPSKILQLLVRSCRLWVRVCEAQFDYLDGVLAWVAVELGAAEVGLVGVVMLRAYSYAGGAAWFRYM